MSVEKESKGRREVAFKMGGFRGFRILEFYVMLCVYDLDVS